MAQPIPKHGREIRLAFTLERLNVEAIPPALE
jgi:hypothetical protein